MKKILTIILLIITFNLPAQEYKIGEAIIGKSFIANLSCQITDSGDIYIINYKNFDNLNINIIDTFIVYNNNNEIETLYQELKNQFLPLNININKIIKINNQEITISHTTNTNIPKLYIIFPIGHIEISENLLDKLFGKLL